jgi:ABC-type transporter Mla maintaining outer membrane lipid asymmetry ATPase subunit MlaF
VPNSATNLIQLFDIKVARAEALTPHPIIRDVTWSIAEHDLWVVGGLPGTGKSDLLATAAALQKPLMGTHLLFGKDVRDMDEHELLSQRLRIGIVFGNGGRLFPQLTIAENLALPICYHRDCSAEEAAPEVNKALQICDLMHIATRRSGEVTRNLHQRIGLARALALQPEILMIDNPLLGVDPRQARWWIDFLCNLHKGHRLIGRPLTIVIATDDLRPWTEVGHQFALIKDKEWHVIGAREALRQSSDPLVREMLATSFEEAEPHVIV